MKQSRPRVSSFKDPQGGPAFLEAWNARVEALNGSVYQRLTVETDFGATRIWAHQPERLDLPPLVFLPGARTCGLFWDLDHVLAPLKSAHRIYIPDVVGQPGLSAGQCPDIKTLDYGVWAEQVFKGLKLERATVIGASQGGLIGVKLCLKAPDCVEKLIMLNPGGIQPFSTRFKNLYYNFLPMLLPGEKSLRAFFDAVVLHPPTHTVSAPAYRLMLDYMHLALTGFRFAGDYPTPLRPEELRGVPNDTHLVLGDQDLLFPTQGTIQIAQAHFQALRSVNVLPGIGHGIETSPQAIAALQQILAA